MMQNIDLINIPLKVLHDSIDAPNNLEESISERFVGLFPNIPMMIATIISFTLAFIFLTFFLYKPVKKMLKERHDFIQSNIDESIKVKEEAINKTNEANKHLQDAHIQANKIVNDAKVRSEKVIIAYTAKAKLDSKTLLEEAKLDIKAQKREFNEHAKDKIATLAIELAEKIVKKEISRKNHEEIIEDFLKSDITIEDLK
ncbi:F0F1 ATP synthase subunit B [Mycoplasma anserisalpingitidis]|nr:F0F1 ATP synthase subunit B [Mycoplasma anserisalpingitidis]